MAVLLNCRAAIRLVGLFLLRHGALAGLLADHQAVIAFAILGILAFLLRHRLGGHQGDSSSADNAGADEKLTQESATIVADAGKYSIQVSFFHERAPCMFL